MSKGRLGPLQELWWQAYVLDRESPILLGVDMLKKFGLVIDYKHSTVYSHALQKNLETKVLPSGHLAIHLPPLMTLCVSCMMSWCM